ncbi:hypothetical protein [Nocardiopsis sp. FR26]|uniref:hypothetical protein n=1 Tax=Nocardiopsis sp. FR26 TaxID=2605987 RepID=UPI00135C3F00|nr:hypothetical protein [Nocardiopsis sp. FR26]
MSFHAYEQPTGTPGRRHVATLPNARAASDWLQHRSQQIETPDLYTDNPTVKAYFAEERLKAGQSVTWTVGKIRGLTLTVEPYGHETSRPHGPGVGV